MINVEKIKELDSVKLLTKKGKMLHKNYQDKKIKKKDQFIKDVLDDLEKNHNYL